MTRKNTPKPPTVGGFTITAAPPSAPRVTYFDAFRQRDALAELIRPAMISPALDAPRVAEHLLETGIANPAVIEALAAGRPDDDADDTDMVPDRPAEDTDPETCREVTCRATTLEHDHGPDCTPTCMVCSPFGAKR